MYVYNITIIVIIIIYNHFIIQMSLSVYKKAHRQRTTMIVNIIRWHNSMEIDEEEREETIKSCTKYIFKYYKNITQLQETENCENY